MPVGDCDSVVRIENSASADQSSVGRAFCFALSTDMERLNMHAASARAAEDLDARFVSVGGDYAKLCAARLSIDMTRGKPSAAQLDL